MSRSFRRFLARNRRNPLIMRIARRAESYVRGYNNFDYDPVHNGELFLLKTASNVFPHDSVIVDVGANEGDWTRLALDVCPNATIHAFELVPDTFARLEARMGRESRVHLNAFGLVDRNGVLPVKTAVGNSTRSTLILGAEIGVIETPEIQCPVQTGDSYLNANQMSRIDLLKIDTEGAEHFVLKGFSQALADELIGVIQFEYGRANVATRFLLGDFYAMLEPLGFEIGKLYPNYVNFRAYSSVLEDFLGPNYVAVHRRHSELRSRLAAN